MCGRTEDDGNVTPLQERTRTFTGDQVTAAMAMASGSITGPIVQAAVDARILASDQVAALQALLAAHPELLALAYYNATRDALYSLL
jgi:hypothetical protein